MGCHIELHELKCRIVNIYYIIYIVYGKTGTDHVLLKDPHEIDVASFRRRKKGIKRGQTLSYPHEFHKKSDSKQFVTK